MNILILSWRGPGHPLAGGAEAATTEHAKGWTRAGHTVTLFTSYFKGAKTQETINGVKTIRRGDQFFGVRFEAFKWYLFEKKETFDLVVDEFHGLPFFTPLYVRTRKIGWIHEVAQKVWALNPWPWPFNQLAGFFGKLIEPLIFKFLYMNIPFMTVSNSTKTDLEAWGIRNVTVVTNGVTLLNRMPRFAKNKDFTMIYLSALAKDKGVEDAISAFHLVQKNIPNLRFWIAGQSYPEYTQYLKNKCPEAKFWGYVTNEKKFELLSRAHVLVFPSVHEGWGLVIIEAASVGTPTVAYNVSGVRDSIIDGKTGMMSQDHSPEGLAILIQRLYNNPQILQSLSKNTKEWSKKFTWEESTSKSLNLFKRLLKKY